jgi:purine-nucleoside phosphorylase
MIRRIEEATDFLIKKGFVKPDVGVVLGTGLGNFVQYIDNAVSISYTEIPYFPKATVEFHKGKLIYGRIGDKVVLVMQGRFHYYEGYSMQEITFPIRVMKLLGVQKLLLSNAAGGINPYFKKGDLVLIDDHINLQPDNPLRGENIDSLGVRFPDMSAPYNTEINNVLKKHIIDAGIDFKAGVYASVAGPNLETRAEYRYLRHIGADMVGMSTVPEVIVANHMSLPCAAVSVITDECDPDNLKAVNIEEIVAVANAADKRLSPILRSAILDL